MKNFLYGFLVAALLGLGVFLLVGKFTSSVQTAPQVLGASSGNEHWNPEYFYNGLNYYTLAGNLFNSSTTPNAILYSGTASTTPTLATVGHLTIAAGSTVQYASTTAVTANSVVQVQLEQTTPIKGVTCNTAVNASSSEATSVIFASSTKPSLNGFSITVASAPLTNPFCYAYTINH
jgi:hypothetical protein